MAAEYRIQSFETDLLGVPVGRLSFPRGDAPPAADDLRARAAGWLGDGVWLVSCRVPEGSPSVAALEACGFRAVETLVTFRHRLIGAPAAADRELAGADDHDACLAIAKRAFVNDRLHRDARVPDRVADRVREAWVRNDLAGRADAAFVVRVGGAVAGFNFCLRRGDEAVIDLIAVDTGHRNKGLGRALVAGALAHYRDRAASLRVGTQADNAPSIALYRGTGFEEADRRTTLHWINPDAAPATAGPK